MQYHDKIETLLERFTKTLSPTLMPSKITVPRLQNSTESTYISYIPPPPLPRSIIPKNLINPSHHANPTSPIEYPSLVPQPPPHPSPQYSRLASHFDSRVNFHPQVHSSSQPDDEKAYVHLFYTHSRSSR